MPIEYTHTANAGMVSSYGKEAPPIRNMMHAVGRQLNIRGFIVRQWIDQMDKAIDALGKLVADGLKWKEDRFSWDSFPDALNGLLTGTKFGKVGDYSYPYLYFPPTPRAAAAPTHF